MGTFYLASDMSAALDQASDDPIDPAPRPLKANGVRTMALGAFAPQWRDYRAAAGAVPLGSKT